MFLASAVTASLLAAFLAYSAVKKLGRSEEVVRSYARAGVPERWLAPLAVVLLAGAIGLVAGLWWAPLGVAAAVCLGAYFGAAVLFHVRARDSGRLATPATLAVLAVVSAALRVASLDDTIDVITLGCGSC